MLLGHVTADPLTPPGGNHDDANFGKAASTPGGPLDRFTNEWHLYVAHTYDRGATWVTTDTTPTDPTPSFCKPMQVAHTGTPLT